MKKSQKLLVSAFLAASMLIGTGTVSQAASPGPIVKLGGYSTKSQCVAVQQQYTRDRAWRVVINCHYSTSWTGWVYPGWRLAVQAAY